MKEKNTQMWIPLYVDKWIFGSTRIELEPAERGVFVDLMAFGAKDEGYIRANEITAYHHTQLAGLLNIPVALLDSTIAKCIHFDKLTESSPGIYKLTNWEKFQLSDDYKYRISTGRKPVPGGEVRQNSDCSPKNVGPIREDKIVEEKKIEEKKEYPVDFLEFWQAYPHKVGKDAALKQWEAKKPPLETCIKTLVWQKLSPQWLKEGGQFIPMPATWIHQGRWNDENPTKVRQSTYNGGC